MAIASSARVLGDEGVVVVEGRDHVAGDAGIGQGAGDGGG
jgi:hypothetical protein